MNTNIQVEKNSSESNASLLRRFTKRVQGSGILPRVRSIRYSSRKLSSYKVKAKKLSSLAKKAKIKELIKLGKMTERTEGQKFSRKK